MSRITNQTNLWGKTSGPDIQRSDLWIIDFTTALTGIASVLNNTAQMTSGVAVPLIPTKLASYYAISVSLPELKTRNDPVRRDARAYTMPSWDEPLDPIRIVFLLDCFKPGSTSANPYQSDIYQMLDGWRAIVRAGRGGMSQEFAITLNNNYRIDYAFDFRVLLLRGSSSPTVANTSAAVTAGNLLSLVGGVAGGLGSAVSGLATATATNGLSIGNDLEFSMKFRIVNAWLSSFKLSELTYEGTRMVQLETIFQADDVLRDTTSN